MIRSFSSRNITTKTVASVWVSALTNTMSAPGTPSREKRKKPSLAPITVPVEAKPKYHITDSGTFSEGDLTISREGLVIGNTDSPASSRPNSSRGSGTSALAATTRDALSTQRDGSASEPSTAGDGGFDVSLDDLEELSIVGSGSSGVVRKVRHQATGDLLVLKVIQFDVQSDQLRKQVTQELRMLHSMDNQYVVRYYQSFFDNGAITAVIAGRSRTSAAPTATASRRSTSQRLPARSSAGSSTSTATCALCTETSSRQTFCSTSKER
uniref:mitogen-activated protein kinase kinase n=1 Tax=Tetraselmis sp. GSL018 TaxID=582737 RepID=A0A061RQ89_9CHLO